MPTIPSLSMFGNKPGNNITGKSVSVLTAGTASQIPNCRQRPICPKCGEKKVWRDSHRTNLFGPTIQRWLCSSCFFRFSDPVDLAESKKAQKEAEKMESMGLKSAEAIQFNCQICVQETKNLVADQKIIVNPQGNELANQNPEGAILNLLWMLKKENKAVITIQKYDYSLHQILALGVNLVQPETFIEKMALSTFTETRKYSLAKAYNCFLKHNGIDAKIPKYKPTRSLPYIPPDPYLDQLVTFFASYSPCMACLFQTLKETAARPGEALRMLWQDLDVGNRKLAINHPEKGSNPRVLPISEKLLNMLEAMRGQRRTNDRIFPYRSADSAGRSFRKMRRRAAKNLGNPELLKIYFYTCRYWRATSEYHKTRDFGAVMYLLGHKSLKYVLLYAQLDKTYFGGNIEYLCKEAFTRQEAMKLIEAGFDLVMTDTEGVSLFRKIK